MQEPEPPTDGGQCSPSFAVHSREEGVAQSALVSSVEDSRGALAADNEPAPATSPPEDTQSTCEGDNRDANADGAPAPNVNSSSDKSFGVNSAAAPVTRLTTSCTNNSDDNEVDELAAGCGPSSTAAAAEVTNAIEMDVVGKSDSVVKEALPPVEIAEPTPPLPMVSFIALPVAKPQTNEARDEHDDDSPPALVRGDAASDPQILSSISGLQVSAFNESSVFRSTTSGKSNTTVERSTPRRPMISIREDDAVSSVPLSATAGSSAERRTLAPVTHASTHSISRGAFEASPAGDDTEQGIRRRIELLSNELTARLSPPKHLASPSRLVSDVVGSLNTTQQMTATNHLVSPSHRGDSGNDEGTSTARRRVSLHGRAVLQAHSTSAASQPDYRKMRDGIIAMSTAVRCADFETIVQSREVKLSLLLDEKVALKRKLNSLESDIELLVAQKADLEALRHNHHIDECRLKGEVSAVLQQVNQLKWDETSLHTQITDLTASLHRFRHKRSTEEMKLLEELNAVSYELATLERAVAEEKSAYTAERQRLRVELRALQEEIVEFKPAQWLASAMVTSKAKLLGQQLGDDRRAQQFLSPALALADRRKTIAHIEEVRGALDSFLCSGAGAGTTASVRKLATV